MKEEIKLDELQLKIMQVIWKRGEASAIEIREDLLPHRDFAITTIGTVLARLRKKGLLKYRKDGRQYIYRPVVSEEATRASMLERMTDQLFKGNASAMVNYLIKTNDLEESELRELQALIETSLKEQKK